MSRLSALVVSRFFDHHYTSEWAIVSYPNFDYDEVDLSNLAIGPSTPRFLL